MRFRHLARTGPYVRVADPSWADPLDGSFAAQRGGRWNPPRSFLVVYLCRGDDVARANVERRFAGLPFGLLDLLPDRRPVLVETEIPAHRAVDAWTDAGCRAARLPETYPLDARRRRVTWSQTQPVGAAAWEQGERSIACRSAAIDPPERGEELAWFIRARRDRLRVRAVRSFDDWF